ncbi:sulfatase/phosphatase domain-containing protein [Streptomyces sp. NPDC005507]|uniref:sulfatase/phosphatase domain-containing protein n=1 Tax=Streptomyces sp. NPDC005507 TaxID=3154885 RepID=UPI0033AA9C73
MERGPQRLAPVPDGPRAHPGCREGSRQASPWRQARHRKVGRNLPRSRGRTLQYRYFEHLDVCHGVQANYGIRTREHKLIHYPGHGSGQVGASPQTCAPQWELFDLERDPDELHNRYDDPEYAQIVEDLTARLTALQLHYLDTPEHVSAEEPR